MSYFNNEAQAQPAYYQGAPDDEFQTAINLTESARNRLLQFLNRPQHVGMRTSDVITVLLDAVDRQPDGGASRISKNSANKTPSANPSVAAAATPQNFSRYVNAAPNISHTKPQGPGQFSGYEPPQNDEENSSNEGDDDLNDEDYVDSENSDHSGNENPRQLRPYSAAQTGKSKTSASRTKKLKNLASSLDYYSTHKTISRKKRTAASNAAAAVKKRAVTGTKPKKTYHPERKGIGTGKQKPWTSGLRRRIYELITDWQRDGLLHCRECNRWLKVVHKMSGLRCANVLDHVCVHYGKEVYSCRICFHKTLTLPQIRRHLKIAHAAGMPDNFDDLTSTYEHDLSERLAACFDYTGVGTPPSGDRKLLSSRKKFEVEISDKLLSNRPPSELTSRQFCFQMYRKWRRDGSMFCRQCDRWIRVSNTTAESFNADIVFQHVCGHYGKSLYECKLCSIPAITRNQMAHHIKKAHQASLRENYTETVQLHERPLKDMAAKCFAFPRGLEPPLEDRPAKSAKKRANAASTGKKNTNTWRSKALEHCRLLCPLVVKNSKAVCRICNQTAMAVYPSGAYRPESLINHALNHLEQDMYKCKHCEKTTKKPGYMRYHISVCHKNANTSDYVDSMDEGLDQFLALCDRCFGNVPATS